MVLCLGANDSGSWSCVLKELLELQETSSKLRWHNSLTIGAGACSKSSLIGALTGGVRLEVKLCVPETESISFLGVGIEQDLDCEP